MDEGWCCTWSRSIDFCKLVFYQSIYGSMNRQCFLPLTPWPCIALAIKESLESFMVLTSLNLSPINLLPRLSQTFV